MSDFHPYVVKTSDDPAADGTEISYTADEDMVIKSWSVSLVSDANVANRHVQFSIEDANGTVYYRVIAGGTQAASLTRKYVARPGDFDAPAVDNDIFILPLPQGGVFIPKDGKLKSITLNVQATDDFGALSLFARRA